MDIEQKEILRRGAIACSLVVLFSIVISYANRKPARVDVPIPVGPAPLRPLLPAPCPPNGPCPIRPKSPNCPNCPRAGGTCAFCGSTGDLK
jgi:hypothetical protein